jgi:hypothetical protein
MYIITLDLIFNIIGPVLKVMEITKTKMEKKKKKMNIPSTQMNTICDLGIPI